ncbi:DegT/DnrJ/EryC1/StrS family aminotransferase [Rubellicoccus peritrichatus]|uniref:DegT/DnrJ/EryC1/StrS family aminotransferase n=1 Tax=Rubellicoccus peritrichatus TaxID=3080537 RepID=A0AAQ3LFN6_9BACT|nr:DegT/DnrJ/EryC1/StrS family aminotransferase [Puniceicoccus sp. CR14]WOO42955.1 DegT/DnrJ/EryC1/StrS family aminotransferase [Puniceicoccus sp. CR14]
MTTRQPIPFLDIGKQYDSIREDAVEAFKRIADSTAYCQGPETLAFEKEFAEWSKASHCVSVNSGTSALHLALHCLDIKEGDEVITVPMTFVSTAWAILYVNAKPVFVDIDPIRRTMNPKQLENAITPRTKAIIPVHLYGMPADMNYIMEIADRHNIPVIEDAAQAHGATYKDRQVGAFGAASCFSFYPGKNLGALGEGGALLTESSDIAERARRLRNHSQPERYHHDELGYNYRMDSIQAAMLRIKLKRLRAWNEARSKHAKKYRELLSGLPIGLPQEPEDSSSAWHLFVIETPERDKLAQALKDEGIMTGLHYPIPLHLQAAFEYLGYSEGEFPITEKLAKECLSLPLFPELTIEQIERVSNSIHKFF